MLSNQLHSLYRNLVNFPGQRTSRKLVVFESDDWGSIRMSSAQAFQNLLDRGLDLTSNDHLRYNKYDALETASDLEMLYEVLNSVRDKNNNPCIFTAMTIQANPDFEKIKNSGFQQYYFEPFTSTYLKYPGCESSYDRILDGIRTNIFLPQFHGREHLNVSAWMRALQNGHMETKLAFDYGIWGFCTTNTSGKLSTYQAAFDFADASELPYMDSIILEGIELFRKYMGYDPVVFTAPNGVLNRRLELTAYNAGIKYISTAYLQKEPQGHEKYKLKLHYIGQQNESGIRYVTRNCSFEPSYIGKDWIDACLKQVDIAFKWGKPAVIGTHRVNYIGALDPANRNNGLGQLKELLNKLISHWPDLEFISTPELMSILHP